MSSTGDYRRQRYKDSILVHNLCSCVCQTIFLWWISNNNNGGDDNEMMMMRWWWWCWWWNCTSHTSPTDCSTHSWRDTFFGKHEPSAPWLLICGVLGKHLLTYLITYLRSYSPIIRSPAVHYIFFLLFMPPTTAGGGSIMFSDRPSVRPSIVCRAYVNT